MMHSLAPKMGITSVLSRPLCIGGNEDCWNGGCRMRPEGPKIEAEGRERGEVLGMGAQAPPARRPCSDVNKTKFLRPRPRPK